MTDERYREYLADVNNREVLGASPMIGKDTAVLSLQNGWGNAPRIASIVGEERVLVGLTCVACKAVDEDAAHFLIRMARARPHEITLYVGGPFTNWGGYTDEFPVERYYRDAPLMVIGEGTNEIQRLVIARGLLARASA